MSRCRWGFAMAAILSCACHDATGPAAADKTRRAIEVETGALHRIRVERRVDLAGTLASTDTVRVSTQVAGIVDRVAVELGAEVQANDMLVRLEPSELAFAVTRAESALRQVEAQLGLDSGGSVELPEEEVASVRQAQANRDDARNAYQRAQQLTTRQLLARVDVDSAETRLKIAEANYQAAIDNVHSLKAALEDRRASVQLAKKRLGDAVVRAPVSGAVAERSVYAGEYLRENTPVATIVGMNPLVLKTAIQEKNAGLIRAGQRVDFVVEAFPERAFQGQVAYVGPAVDQATRTFPVEVFVDNPRHELRPGFFAKGAVLTHVDEQVLAAPDDAVSTLAGVSTVFVIENGKARQQEVILGVQQRGLVEIISGLKGGEHLATNQLNQLATGMHVTEVAGSSGLSLGDARSAVPPSGGALQ